MSSADGKHAGQDHRLWMNCYGLKLIVISWILHQHYASLAGLLGGDQGHHMYLHVGLHPPGKPHLSNEAADELVWLQQLGRHCVLRKVSHQVVCNLQPMQHIPAHTTAITAQVRLPHDQIADAASGPRKHTIPAHSWLQGKQACTTCSPQCH